MQNKKNKMELLIEELYNPTDYTEYVNPMDYFGELVKSHIEQTLRDLCNDLVLVSYIPSKSTKKYKSHISVLILHYYKEEKMLDASLSYSMTESIDKVYADYLKLDNFNTLICKICEKIIDQYTTDLFKKFFKE